MNIIRYFQNTEDIQVVLVSSNVTDSGAIKRAKKHNIPTLIFNKLELNEGVVLEDMSGCTLVDASNYDSSASIPCTTNCLAPVADVIIKNFIIEKGFMPTIHSFTTDQRLLDNSHKDPRRARSAPQSIVPTSTGASKAIGEIIPDLKGKLEGVAMRVPTPNVSLVELVFCTKKELTINKINDALIKSSKQKLKGILEVTKEKLVSIDFNHNPNSAIIDASLTNVVGKNMGKISAWYDNEWGFSNRMCDLVKYIHKI